MIDIFGDNSPPLDEEGKILLNELKSIPDLAVRSARCVRKAYEYVLDGEPYFDELEASVKTVMGTKTEKYWLQEIGLPMKMTKGRAHRLLLENPIRGDLVYPKLDTIIHGIDVDLKHTISNGGWMIPPEAVNQWLLLFQSDVKNFKFSLGVLKANPCHLTKGTNQDKKHSLSTDAMRFITPVIINHPF